MIAAPSLYSSSISSPLLLRDRIFLRSSSLPSIRTVRSTPNSRFSTSYASAAERERERSGSYNYSQSNSSGATAAAVGTLYDVLGLSSGATGQEIKAAYRRLARACHPDVVATGRKDTSAGEFMRIHAAYSTLSDPDKRADYDRRMSSAARWRPSRSASSATSPSSYSSYSYSSSASFSSSDFARRTWETDQCW